MKLSTLVSVGTYAFLLAISNYNAQAATLKCRAQFLTGGFTPHDSKSEFEVKSEETKKVITIETEIYQRGEPTGHYKQKKEWLYEATLLSSGAKRQYSCTPAKLDCERHYSFSTAELFPEGRSYTNRHGEVVAFNPRDTWNCSSTNY
jgi:hypothetical protein